MHSPRKVCSKCGSVNHLAIHCKDVAPYIFSPSMSALVYQNFSGLDQMSFLPNPYFQYGNVNMSSMPWSTPSVNNSLAYKYPNDKSKSYSQNENFVKSKGQRPTPRVKVELSSSKPKVETLVTKPKASIDKPGTKATWVPKLK